MAPVESLAPGGGDSLVTGEHAHSGEPVGEFQTSATARVPDPAGPARTCRSAIGPFRWGSPRVNIPVRRILRDRITDLMRAIGSG